MRAQRFPRSLAWLFSRHSRVSVRWASLGTAQFHESAVFAVLLANSFTCRVVSSFDSSLLSLSSSSSLLSSSSTSLWSLWPLLASSLCCHYYIRISFPALSKYIKIESVWLSRAHTLPVNHIAHHGLHRFAATVCATIHVYDSHIYRIGLGYSRVCLWF